MSITYGPVASWGPPARHQVRRPPLGRMTGAKPPCGPPQFGHLDPAAPKGCFAVMSIRKWTRASAECGRCERSRPVCYLSREHEAHHSGVPRSGMCPRRADPSTLKSGEPEANEPYRRTRYCRAPAGLPRTKVSLRLSQCDCTESFTTPPEMTVIPVPLDEGGTRHDYSAGQSHGAAPSARRRAA